MAPAITAPPMTPAATPGPHPHPRRRHWAETSVAVAVNVSATARLLRKTTLVLHWLADEGYGSEHDNSCNERCHARIRQDFIENSGHCFPRATSPIRAIGHCSTVAKR